MDKKKCRKRVASLSLTECNSLHLRIAHADIFQYSHWLDPSWSINIIWNLKNKKRERVASLKTGDYFGKTW